MKIRALLAEDNPDDAELVMDELRRAGLECHWQRVDRPEAFLSAIEHEPWDVILSDFRMPLFSAPEALEILKSTGRDIPFIIVSGSVGEQVAVEAMKAGAHDFFAKTNLHRLGAAIEREVREARVRQERHQAVLKLRRAEERYRLIVQNVRDWAIFMLDAHGKVASWSPGAEHLLGYGEADILGQPFASFFPPPQREAGLPAAMLSAASETGSHQEEGPRVRRDGSQFWALTSLDRIGNPDLLGYSAIVRDTSERKRLLDDLQQAVRARDEFLSIASHELKTPLTSLELQLESLQQMARSPVAPALSDDKVGRKLAIVSRQADRLTELVNNLLDVTRITSGRLDLRLEAVDLRDVVTAVVSRMRDTLERAECQLTIEVPQPLIGQWDRLRMESAVANLLSNAARYGAGKPVMLTAERAGDLVRLCVCDQGIGMSIEQQARIFQRFERAVPDEHYGGLGLGLWIVRQIVESHGGTVRVGSRVGEGSTFTMELPLQRQAER